MAAMIEASDAELMARVRGGDRRAFAWLVRRYQGTLVSYLARTSGSRARAEDLAQEAFLRLFEHAQRYREEGKLAAWLYRTATNLLRSDERRIARWRKLASPGDEAADAPQEDALLADEARHRLSDALLQVPILFRAPLVLHAIEERSFEEIADVLQVPVGTVKSRISRGRALLREALAPADRLRGVADGS